MGKTTLGIQRLQASKTQRVQQHSFSSYFFRRNSQSVVFRTAVRRTTLWYLQKNVTVVPPWVIVMYNTGFFRNCVSHPNAKKNRLDRFCTDCAQSFCSHCLPAHALHKHVKIRRYMYNDVINRQDLCKLFNCSGIQTYHTNKAKVLFLKQRTHHHQQSNSRDCWCIICEKNLQDNSLYCSIACKVLHIYRDNELYRLKDEDEDEDEEATFLQRRMLTKKPRIRHSRKGVPLRAPMF